MPLKYPFSAVVGCEYDPTTASGLDDMGLALVLTSISPAIGGVLVRGEKGTAKSTVVRALAALLPDVDVLDGCRFGCDPTGPDPDCPDAPHGAESHRRPARLFELPVGATEDRVIGSLDLERALTEGVRAYQPGYLALTVGPILEDVVNALSQQPDIILVNAAGRDHIRGAGLAIQLGPWMPTRARSWFSRPVPEKISRHSTAMATLAPSREGR